MKPKAIFGKINKMTKPKTRLRERENTLLIPEMKEETLLKIPRTLKV